jgi:hypothetical protein
MSFGSFSLESVLFYLNITLPANLQICLDKQTKEHIQAETCALGWALWKGRNDIVFNRGENSIFL